MEGYITTTEAAKKLGVTPARVRQLVMDGVLPVQRLGSVNLIKESDLHLAVNRRGVGRPPKATKKGSKK